MVLLVKGLVVKDEAVAWMAWAADGMVGRRGRGATGRDLRNIGGATIKAARRSSFSLEAQRCLKVSFLVRCRVRIRG